MRSSSYPYLFLLLGFSIILSSCGSTKPFLNPLSHQTNYADTIPHLTEDRLWGKVVDFCTQEGLSIKIIDRKEGLIVITKKDLRCTYELDSNGTLKDSTSYLVIEKRINGIRTQTDKKLSAEWNIRIRNIESGTNVISLFLIYARDQQVYSTKYDTYLSERDLQAYSTGLLEKELFRYLRKQGIL